MLSLSSIIPRGQGEVSEIYNEVSWKSFSTELMSVHPGFKPLKIMNINLLLLKKCFPLIPQLHLINETSSQIHRTKSP